MKPKSCRTCEFWQPQNNDLGECRYALPTILPSTSRGVWPIVHQDDWCRLWHIKQEMLYAVDPDDPDLEKKLNMLVRDLGFSTRVRNILEAVNIYTVRDLLTHPKDLREYENFGEISFREVEAKLHQLGLRLRSPARRFV